MVVTETIEMYVEYCCECGMPFAMTKRFQKKCKETGDTFCCPSGHKQHYTESDIGKLQRNLNEEKRLRAQVEYELQIEKGSNRALRGVITKTKKRVSKGICPCCNRQFVNMTRHMETQHPNYEKEGAS